MPRKLRIEYVGATNHIISRGNYRKDLFVQKRSGEAFERTIFETVQRCGWELYAYVKMKKRGKSESEIIHDGKSAPWKVAIAKRLRRETTAGNPWIVKRLRMGSPNYVSNLIHA